MIDDDDGAVIDVCQSFELISDGPKVFGPGYESSRIVLVSCSEGRGNRIDDDEFDGEWRLSRGSSTTWYWCFVIRRRARNLAGESGGLQSFDVSGDEKSE